MKAFALALTMMVACLLAGCTTTDTGGSKFNAIVDAAINGERGSTEQQHEAGRFGLENVSSQTDLSKVPQTDPDVSENTRHFSLFKDEVTFPNRKVTKFTSSGSSSIDYGVTYLDSSGHELYTLFCDKEGNVIWYRVFYGTGIPRKALTYCVRPSRFGYYGREVLPGDLIRIEVWMDQRWYLFIWFRGGWTCRHSDFMDHPRDLSGQLR